MVMLHKLFDDGFDLIGKDSALVDSAAKRVVEICDGVKCFDIGDADELKNVALIESDVGHICLPYAHCWFEFQAVFRDGGPPGAVHYGALLSRDETAVSGLLFFRGGPTERFLCYGLVNHSGGKLTVKGASDPMGFEFCDTNARYTFTVLCRFLKMLGCANVDHIEFAPDERLQKARKKEGKFRYLAAGFVC